MDILVHYSTLQFFCVPKVLIEMPAHTNSFIFVMALRRQIGFYDEPTSLTRNYGTRVLPSQLDASLGPTPESLAPTGGLAGSWLAYPPILCGPSKTR